MTASSKPAMPTLYAGFTLSDWFASSGAPASSSACVWMRCWMMSGAATGNCLPYRQAPCRAHGRALSVRFDEIFGQRTGYASLDNLLRRLRANKDELLRVLEYPATPPNSNGAKTDIRAHVTRRKISFGTRSESRRAARDACLGALKTCNKLGVPFWSYLRDRLGVAGAAEVPRLAEIITQRATA